MQEPAHARGAPPHPRRARIDRGPTLVAAAVMLALAASSAGVAHPALERQIADLDARIAASPNDAELLVRRGELHRHHRDFGAAEADFRRALGIAPTSGAARLGLGRLLTDMGRHAEALEAFDPLIEAEPRSPAARAARARALAAVGRHLEAAADLTVALAADDPRGRPEQYIDRARALVAAGPEHREQALAGLLEGLERLGRPVTLELEALEIEIDLGRNDAALARLDRLARETPRPETWWIRRARLLESLGRPAEALETYRRIVDSLESGKAPRRQTRAVQQLVEEARLAVERLALLNGSRGAGDPTPSRSP